MTLSVLWVAAMAASILYACYNGTAPLLTPALTAGITAAVEFCLTAGSMMVFWCGFFAVMERTGLSHALSRMLRPLLARLFPTTVRNASAFTALSANVSANLLGLGNAATPMGIRAAERMSALPNAGRELACLVVMNTASIQLLPTTVVSVRSALGCATPMDILPCVLLTSLLALTAGLGAVQLLYRL